VLNGVDKRDRNNHEDGHTRVHATGRLDLGYPNLSELFASVEGKALPMAHGSTPGASRTSAGPWLRRRPMGRPVDRAARAGGARTRQSASADYMKQSDLDKGP